MTAPRPFIGVFAVEDTSVQLTWRGLGPGLLGFQVAGTDVSAEVEVDAGPGAIELTALPADRHLMISVTPPGDAHARMVVPVRTLPALPGRELTRLATISDLHLGTTVFGHQGTITEVPTPQVAHPERCAAAAIAEAARWGARHLVVKGDLTNHGRVEEWRTYSRLVSRAPFPVDALPGNHDRAFKPEEPGLTPEVAAKAFGLSMAMPVLVRDLEGLRVVLVDSTTGGRNLGHIEPFADEVLDAVSEADPHRAVLVALHHQLQPHTVSEGWPIGVGRHESIRFLDRLGAAHPRVLVTSGHTHRHRRWDHGNVTATQVGATKDFPGVWAGYVVHEGGIRQVVRRVTRPDCMTWTDHTRRAAMGTWRWISPGRLSARCFNLTWP